MNESNTPDFGQRVKKLFDQCVDQPRETINEILNVSHENQEVIDRVKSLLNHNDNNALELTQTLIKQTNNNQILKPLQPQVQISEYTLDKPLGQGGQGEVWKAHRGDGQFNHDVAIKFLKPVYTKKELSRFHNERELLAALKHYNIAHLISGGEFQNRPYMVMEWVDGKPLIEFCQLHKTSLANRLGYFLQICDAISYAHMNRVIHRDIKPSNVLITKDKVVKLLDFGIAKTFAKSQNTEYTETAITMTLAYSSPEQVTGKPVSTATDVYALGLFLYELLTGNRAQGHQSEIPAKVIQEITTKSPSLPSETEWHEPHDIDYSLAQLSGDLDNLIMKAISKEPQRRYDSAQALANDVRNYLAGRPIIATGDNWLYKTKKLIKRNPVSSALTFVALGLMIVLPVILLFYQQQVQNQRDEAQKQATVAQRSNDFLTTLLRSASPLGANDGEVLLKDVLKIGEAQIEGGLNDQPLTKAPLLILLGDIHNNLQQYDKSIGYYEKAYDLYEQENDIKGKIQALNQLGFVLYEHGKLTESKIAIAKANQLFNTATKLDPEFQAIHLSRQATMLNFIGEKEQARTVIDQALNLLESNKINNYSILGRLYNERALAHRFKNEVLAVEYFDEAIKYGKLVNENDPFSFFRQQSKAVSLISLGLYDEALAAIQEGKKGIKKLYSENHKNYADIIIEEAYIYHDLGNYNQAEIIYKKAMSIYLTNDGTNASPYIIQLNNLAFLYEDMRQFEKAEPLYRQSLLKRRKIYASQPMRVASGTVNLARLLAKINRFDEAQVLLDEAMPIYMENKKSNLYNEVTQLAIAIGDGMNDEKCQQGVNEINDLTIELDKQSKTSWRRMQAELWLGQMAIKCNHKQLAENLLTAALRKSQSIYKPGSDGQKIMAKQVPLGLASINY